MRRQGSAPPERRRGVSSGPSPPRFSRRSKAGKIARSTNCPVDSLWTFPNLLRGHSETQGADLLVSFTRSGTRPSFCLKQRFSFSSNLTYHLSLGFAVKASTKRGDTIKGQQRRNTGEMAPSLAKRGVDHCLFGQHVFWN